MQMPRENAIEAVMHYNKMRCAALALSMPMNGEKKTRTHRDELMTFLKPLAEAGEPISQADIQRFFEQQRNGS